MTDSELRDLIQKLDGRARPWSAEVGVHEWPAFVEKILEGLRERGGRFVWNGVEYTENPPGKLARGLPWRSTSFTTSGHRPKPASGQSPEEN